MKLFFGLGKAIFSSYGIATLVCLLVLGASETRAQAQDNGNITHEDEVWGAYLTSIKINDTWALWNDWQYASGTSWISRHGLTYAVNENLDFTAGYAIQMANTGFTNNFIRNEQRPWFQMIKRFTLSDKLTFLFRFRNDIRFREIYANDGTLLDEREFSNRVRFLGRFRIPIYKIDKEHYFHYDLANEVLLNFGNDNLQPMDQNRFFNFIGYSNFHFTFLLGYHLRTVPRGNDRYIYRHSVNFWIYHTIGKKRKDRF